MRMGKCIDAFGIDDAADARAARSRVYGSGRCEMGNLEAKVSKILRSLPSSMGASADEMTGNLPTDLLFLADERRSSVLKIPEQVKVSVRGSRREGIAHRVVAAK